MKKEVGAPMDGSTPLVQSEGNIPTTSSLTATLLLIRLFRYSEEHLQGKILVNLFALSTSL